MNHPTPVVVSGMFRSGTTLLGRVLNAHPDVVLASDPCLPFFKHLRSTVAREIGQAVSTGLPLGDYSFSSEHIALLDANLKADLSLPLVDSIGKLREDCKKYGAPYSPLIAERIGELVGTDYRQVFESLLQLIQRCGGNDQAKMVGFKVVWADEFIPAIVRSTNAKVIQIIRDPRAVCASKKSREAKYPWLFLGRQWRKLASLSFLYSTMEELQGRVLAVRFEDLVSNLDGEVERIRSFLGLSKSQEMADPTTYKDGTGKPWLANSSSGKAVAKMDLGALDRWKRKLDPEEVQAVESLCWPEMALWGYEPISNCQVDPVGHPRFADDELAMWIRDVVDNSEVATSLELCKEHLRHALLKDSAKGVGEPLVRSAFLFPEIFDAIQARAHKLEAE